MSTPFGLLVSIQLYLTHTHTHIGVGSGGATGAEAPPTICNGGLSPPALSVGIVQYLIQSLGYQSKLVLAMY